jgi:ADP-heptose:LPS heptosyltransferase
MALAKSGGRVIVAVKEEWQEIFPKHDNIKLVSVNVSYSKYRNKKAGLLKSFLDTVRVLREEASGAIGLDIRGDVRSICLMYLAGCTKVESFNRYFTANDCSVPCGSVSVRRAIDRTLLRYELNKLLLPSFAQEYFSLPTLTHLIDPATKCDMIGGAIALVPLAGWNGKEWIPEAWKGLIYSLKSRGQKLVLVHGPKEREQAVAAIGGNALLGAVDIVEATTVGAWVNILNSARAVISVNTGPMHIAAALGKPQLVIEGTSRIPLWAPANRKAIVIHHQDGKTIKPIHQIDANAEYSKHAMSLVTSVEVLSQFDRL